MSGLQRVFRTLKDRVVNSFREIARSTKEREAHQKRQQKRYVAQQQGQWFGLCPPDPFRHQRDALRREQSRYPNPHQSGRERARRVRHMANSFTGQC